MGNKRIITSSMWEDEFFTGLLHFDRLLWIGLITCVADDQGRMQDNAALIRSKVFPLDDVRIADVDTALCGFNQVGKIARYIANEKKCIQIVNWWKHQAPNWAGHSLLPAPAGWMDRERYHGKNTADGKQTIITVNWDKIGGYIANYIEPKDSPNDRHDIKGDIKGDIEGEGEGEGNTGGALEWLDEDGAIAQLSKQFEVSAQILAYDEEKWLKAIREMFHAGVTPEMLGALVYDMRNPQNGNKKLTITGPWSCTRMAIARAAEHRINPQPVDVGGAF